MYMCMDARTYLYACVCKYTSTHSNQESLKPVLPKSSSGWAPTHIFGLVGPLGKHVSRCTVNERYWRCSYAHAATSSVGKIPMWSDTSLADDPVMWLKVLRMLADTPVNRRFVQPLIKTTRYDTVFVLAWLLQRYLLPLPCSVGCLLVTARGQKADVGL